MPDVWELSTVSQVDLRSTPEHEHGRSHEHKTLGRLPPATQTRNTLAGNGESVRFRPRDRGAFQRCQGAQGRPSTRRLCQAPPMNVANLQLEGLMMAVAAINNALVHHGVLSIDAMTTLYAGPKRPSPPTSVCTKICRRPTGRRSAFRYDCCNWPTCRRTRPACRPLPSSRARSAGPKMPPLTLPNYGGGAYRTTLPRAGTLLHRKGAPGAPRPPGQHHRSPRQSRSAPPAPPG